MSIFPLPLLAELGWDPFSGICPAAEPGCTLCPSPACTLCPSPHLWESQCFPHGAGLWAQALSASTKLSYCFKKTS